MVIGLGHRVGVLVLYSDSRRQNNEQWTDYLVSIICLLVVRIVGIYDLSGHLAVYKRKSWGNRGCNGYLYDDLNKQWKGDSWRMVTTDG